MKVLLAICVLIAVAVGVVAYDHLHPYAAIPVALVAFCLIYEVGKWYVRLRV